MNGDEEHTRRRAKVGHKKSRRGCQKCKYRRVKCDEKRPKCGNCTRLDLDCSWSDAVPLPTPSPGPAPGTHFPADICSKRTEQPIFRNPSHASSSIAEALYPGSTAITSLPSSGSSSSPTPLTSASSPSGSGLFASFQTQMNDTSLLLPESRARRLLEHRLMQHYLVHMSAPFPQPPSPSWTSLFQITMPSLALRHDNILHALLTNAAAHLHRQCPDDISLGQARQAYLIEALRAQREAVEDLTSAAEIDVDLADAVCFTSLLLLINSFAMLSQRPLQPYTPPLDWLSMGRGAGALIWTSVESILRSSPALQSRSKIMVVANSYPRFGADDSYYSPAMRRVGDLESVLSRSEVLDKSSRDDMEDEETKEAYEKTLSYVGSVQNAMDTGEPVYAVCRRVQAFSLLVPRAFIGFLEEGRPRALVSLARFWGCVSQVKGVWWLTEGVGTDGEPESIARREIRAIAEVLPAEWRGMVVSAMDVAGVKW